MPPPRQNNSTVRIGILIVALLVLPAGIWWTLRTGLSGPNATPAMSAGLAAPTYVGRQSCVECHATEVQLWTGSHHDLAMDVASATTVLGDFDDAQIEHFGTVSTLFQRDGRYFARTDGPAGTIREFEVVYTFGVTPLQQYLVRFPDGRYQTLPICWDDRPADAGGQRWFHIYPDEPIPHNDELHWTGPNQNWNFMCSECHSTDLRKNYDVVTDRYSTQWSEIDVSCEACHGPASRHLAWARGEAFDPEYSDDAGMGLMVSLKDPNVDAWQINPETGNAERTRPIGSQAIVETCARCHARRSVIEDEYLHGRPLMDTHRPALLEERLYHADGQILEEVYVYGSFLQSKMHEQGVTCLDCHNAHALTVHTPGNDLCYRCHSANQFDVRAHHHHEPESQGAKCVNCHMPATNYMVVDPRLDHSIRIPRPDLSVSLGTPNACNQCHTDQSAQWAMDTVSAWYGTDRIARPHYGEALHLGRTRQPGATAALLDLAGDSTQPGIARATALALLPALAGDAAIMETVRTAAADDDPLVRYGAARALEIIEPRARLEIGTPLLDDPVRLVRIEAARALAGAPPTLLTEDARRLLKKATDEYIRSNLVNAERPFAHINLGNLQVQYRDFESAEAAYLTALRLDPDNAAATVNLVDLYRTLDRDVEGERRLTESINRQPRNAALRHALGLLLVRRAQPSEALQQLRRATELAPDVPRYALTYGVALHSLERTSEAIPVLQAAHRRNPRDREILYALATIHRDIGSWDDAVLYAQRLTALAPESPSYAALLQQVVRARDGRR